MARMSLSDILFLYRARLRARAVLVQEGLAVVVSRSASRCCSPPRLPARASPTQCSSSRARYSAVAAVPAGCARPGGFDGRLVEEVRRLPGVRTALPVLEVQANVIGPAGRRSVDLIGTYPQLCPLGRAAVAAFFCCTAPESAGHRVAGAACRGDRCGCAGTFKLQVGASVVHTLIGATLQEADIGGLVNSPIAVTSVAYVQRFAGMGGRITRIFY